MQVVSHFLHPEILGKSATTYFGPVFVAHMLQVQADVMSVGARPMSMSF